TLGMDVQEDAGLVSDYRLKLNSYDLGVDIELADAVERLRFEHPEVRVVVVTSGKDRVFSAGANIHMLASSSHAFKVNFCKFTNETRLAIEDASAHSGIRFLAACNGIAAGGGYELALACDEILLVDDGNSAVSLPEVPLLGVLPGTGGLTRVVDKRRVRRDHADIFCTLAEGVKGQRAVDWRLVDATAPRSRFDAAVKERAAALAAADRGRVAPPRRGPGVALPPLEPDIAKDLWAYSTLGIAFDRKARTATVTLKGPDGPPPEDVEAAHKLGANLWMLRLSRELSDALCRLRFNEPEVGLLVIKTLGSVDAVLQHDARMAALAQTDWYAREVVLHFARTLRRLDVTARSLFALVEPGSCFAGSLLETALAADRTYALDDPKRKVEMALSPLNFGALPMGHDLTRLEVRLLSRPADHAALRGRIQAGETPKYDAPGAVAAGLVTVAADDIDYEDEVRVAIEERASLSPDALTGMEASLRFPGAETPETKIFGRLSAWQNWIFQRPNAVGEHGALKCYGRPERPAFDWTRT
ncbi:MAG TPA: 2,3-epoxybenzoyl-CoA dihydrolase, partial [Candidatus Polarisedimenticolia bacterium]|nr:2,3-epoxybenzoyl-CoA dihydrolase [Candidatus Polarisedimenticolia bacterium]